MNTHQIPSLKQTWCFLLCGIGFTFTLLQQVTPAHAAGAVVAWGDNDSLQCQVPAGSTTVVGVAGGESHSLALKANGTVTAWGFNDSGQTTVPAGLTGVASIAAGANFSLALKTNGTVVVWGGLSAPPSGLTNVTAVAAGSSHALALRSNGTVVAWGSQSTVPAGLSNVKAIAAGNGHNLALLNDGTVLAWGDGTYGKTLVPAGLSNVLAVAAGTDHSLALKTDGTVVAWGRNDYGQANVPASLNNAVAISGGALHTLALRADGSLIAWGDNTFNQTITTPGDAGYIGISAGGYHNLAIKGDGSPYILQSPLSQTVLINKSATFQVVATGVQPLTYQWRHNGNTINGATNSSLALSSVQSGDGGNYTVLVGNLYGNVTSAPALLIAVAGPPVVAVPPQDQTVICGDTANFQVSAGGSTPLTYQWRFQGQPIASATGPGLTLNAVTPAQAGLYDVVITNNFGTVATGAVLTVTVEAPQITSPLSALGAQGQPFSYAIQARHSPLSYGATFLPAGLSIDSNTGIISGVPAESGTFGVLISAVNACTSDNQTLELTIAPTLPVITSPATANATEGQPFNYQITALNSPISFGAQNLPSGLIVDSATGIISGVPTYAGSFDATISANNVWGAGTANLHFTIRNGNIDNLQIGNVTYSYSSPYVLDFQFSLSTLTDITDTNSAEPVVVDPSLLSASCMEDDVPISPSETGAFVAPGNTKVTKIFLVLDFTESIASLSNGDANTNGISDVVDAMLSGAQDFVNQQTADTQIGVYEFHREDYSPSNVVALTTDKTLLNNSIAGILTNYVKGFSAGSRAWDATDSAILDLGAANPDEQHFVILISDGRDESSIATLPQLITLANGNGAKVFCIGFGNELEVTNLQNLASSTQGSYFAAKTAQDLVRQLSLVSKTTKGQYVLRWATLKRAQRPFMPSFQITYQNLTASSPTNPWYMDTNNPIIDTNTTPATTNYNNITNYIIGYYYPQSNAGPVAVGSLRVVPNADIHPTGLDLRATYAPRYIQQVRLHYRANWPCIPTLQSTNLGEWLAGWTMDQTDDGAGGNWLLLSGPGPTNVIPFASFGKMVTFTFRDVIDTANAFSVFDVDNTLYTNSGGQSFEVANTNDFLQNFPVLPHGTPVPWLISYGYGGNFTNAELLDTDHDGMPAWKEYWANTNPTNSASVFAVKKFLRQSDGRFRVTFSSALNRNYQVQGSTDLLSWQIVQDNIAGNGQDITVVDTRYIPNLTNIYYRVLVY